jgi:hypothetical protein
MMVYETTHEVYIVLQTLFPETASSWNAEWSGLKQAT